MHTRLPIITSICAIVGLTAANSAASASRTAFREQRAVLSFTSQSPLTCDDGSSSSLTSDVFLMAKERRLRGERASTLEARVEIVQRNGCTGQMLEAFQTVPVPSAELSGVDGASFDVSFELVDFSSGEPLGVLDVVLDFDAAGGVTRRLEQTSECQGGLSERTQLQLESRQAGVEGAVSLDGADLLDGVEYTAHLEDTRTTVVTQQQQRCRCSGGAGGDSELGDREGRLSSAATVTRTALDVEAANASFRNAEPIVCADGAAAELVTSLFIGATATTFVNDSTPSQSSEASAFVTRSDGCTGEVAVGFAPVAPPDYDQLGIDSATLNLSVELSDPGTGAFVVMLDTALVFSGTGEPSCTSSFAITASPAGVFGPGPVTTIHRSARASRAVSLSGTAFFDGLELVEDLEFGELATSSESTLFIQR
jgi:hypothetical protein